MRLPLSLSTLTNSIFIIFFRFPHLFPLSCFQEIQRLLDSGISPSERSADGLSPLCVAAFWGHEQAVALLLERGADVNITNNGTLWTALHCAAFQGHGKVVMELMEARPNLAVRDAEGRTAVDFASALDVVWPHFARMGCTRTSKSELIRMGIVRKVNDAIAASDDSTTYFSRPGSAYVVQGQSLYGSARRGGSTHSGDVLGEE